LVDFFDSGQIAEKALLALTQPDRFQPLRRQAAITAQDYSTDNGVAGYLKVLGIDLAAIPA